MSLNNFYFIIFFLILCCLMGVLQLFRSKNKKVIRIQLGMLLLFGYAFICFFDWRFFVCLLFITVFTYIVANLIENNENKRIFLVLSLVILVCFLGFFKYTNFFIQSFSSLAGRKTNTLKIILPIGISFYVFSTMSYIIDIYHRRYRVERDFLNFSLYISFFPKLTAGPIVRGEDFFPQVKMYRGIRMEYFKTGIQIFVFGLFKKIVLADHLGVFVDDVFHAPMAFNTGTVILAAISYSLQIYFDFSGYSDMAIGASKIVGFDFKPNFNLPYIAENESEFWERWHISLSSWFRDYLYIPLGGSRKGEGRTYMNLIITMVVSGLWHGAGWTYIVWGFLHGVMSCIYRFFRQRRFKGIKVLNIVITFIIVSLLWIFFRADSMSNAIDFFVSMFTVHTGINQPYTWTFFSIIILSITIIVAKNKIQGDKINGFYPLLDLSRFWSQVAFFTFCGLTIIMGYYGNTAFIYGNF